MTSFDPSSGHRLLFAGSRLGPIWILPLLIGTKLYKVDAKTGKPEGEPVTVVPPATSHRPAAHV
jgi:hypothetical protein